MFRTKTIERPVQQLDNAGVWKKSKKAKNLEFVVWK